MIPKFWSNIGGIIGIAVCGLISIFAKSFSISHAILLVAGILVFIVHSVELIPRFREVVLTKKINSLLNLSSIFNLGLIPFSLLLCYYQIIGWLSRNWYDIYTGFHGNYSILIMMSVPFAVLQVLAYLYIGIFEAKGEFHWSRGEYLQALKVTNSNIERCKWVYGQKHYNASTFIFNLATVYQEIGEQDSIDVRRLEEALNNYTKSSLGYRKDILKFLLYIEKRLDLANFYILRNNELYGKQHLEETLHVVQKASNNKWLSLFVKFAVISSLIGHYITLNNIDDCLRLIFNKETIKVENEIEETLTHSKNNLLKNILCNPFIMSFKEIIIALTLILPCIYPYLDENETISELYMLIVLIPTFLLVHILNCYWDIAYFEYRLKVQLFSQFLSWIQFKNNLASIGENASLIEKQYQKISRFIQKISKTKLLLSEASKTVILAELYVMIAELKLNQISHINLSFHVADEMIYSSKKIAEFYQEAIENYDKALGFYERINHSNIAELNINLFGEPSKLSDSKMIFKKQQSMSERYRTGYAECLINKALACAELQGLNEAEPIINTNFSKAKDVLEISTKTSSIDSYNFQFRLSLYAQALNKLGWLYYGSKRYEDAEIKYQAAEEICNNLVSIFSFDSFLSPKYLLVLNQTWLEITKGNADVALNKLKESQQKFEQLAWLMISISNERVRLDCYIPCLKVCVYLRFSIINRFLLGDISEIKTLFELILQTKGISAEILATQKDKLLEKKYSRLQPQLEQLRLLRKQIAHKEINGLAPLETIADFEKTLELSYQEKEKLEQQLAVEIPELNLKLKLKNVTLTTISKTLPKKYVLVEFVALYDPIEAKEVREEYSDNPQMLLEYQPYFRYVAFVLSSENPENVQMIEIGGRDRINKMIANFRSSIIGKYEERNLEVISSQKNDKKKQNSRESGIALRKAVFDPLVKNLGDCQHIFISPDGDLTRLPFEILPTDDSQRLIDNYSISYLSSSKDILRFGFKTDRQATDAIVIADPDFDYGLGQHSSAIDKELNSSGRQSRDLNLEKLEFKRLDGTRQEGIEIASLLGVEPWLAEKAVKEKLESITSPLILHIATHGFFVEDQPETFHQEQLLSAGKSPITQQENPLLRSGLAFAGANWKQKQFRPPSEVGNGIITAEEVSNLDLSETELVVLSACETGLGDVQTGEGVFGLRRAFVLAGAKTLVMSLWKVPDQQTQELMTEFYRRLLWGEGRGEALRNAQLEMRKKYPDPYYWGAFICQGEISSILR
ncbi:MAG: CHAT domain-containing protein [Microcystis sp.]